MSYKCPYCSKSCAKTFGLRNHLNRCKDAPDGADIEQAYNRAIEGVEKVVEKPDNEWDNDDYVADDRIDGPERRPSREPSAPKSASPFGNIGAFLLLSDFMPALLDIDFAIALGDHILKNGSDNKAILAFGHQLKKLDES